MSHAARDVRSTRFSSISRNYLLAQAQVDAGLLANNIAALNPATTFSPLQPLHDTDVQGYLRHAHEQGIISTIEEGRRETQLEFQRVLDERVRRDWEARKKRIFEELGERASVLPEGKQFSRGPGGRVSATSHTISCIADFRAGNDAQHHERDPAATNDGL